MYQFEPEELREALANDPSISSVFGEDLYSHIFGKSFTSKTKALMESAQMDRSEYHSAKA